MPMHAPRPMQVYARFGLLMLAIALIVVGPFALVRWADNLGAEAVRRVNHTVTVEARLYDLAAAVRNVESAALALAHGVDAPVIDERIADGRARVAPALAELSQLVSDNPEQLLRMGRLQATLEQRMAQAARVAALGPAATRADVYALSVRYPLHVQVQAMIAAENRLLAAREARADSARERSDTVAWLAMLAQLLLLGGVAWFSLRQLDRRLLAEGAAARSSARAASVLDTVREPIALLGADMGVVMHNPAFAELYGAGASVQGQLLANIGGGAWRDEATLRRLGDVLLRGRELWDHVQVQLTADGVSRTMLINARRMTLPDREDEVALLTVNDITAQKADELRINTLNRQLEAKVAQVSDTNHELEAFSYTVSHDLRAPLRHIAGFSEKLGRHLGDQIDDRSRHYLEVIGSSAQRMSQLIDDLLVYSRLGRSALRVQPVDMQSLVEETRAMLVSNAEADLPGHAILWQVAPLPVLLGDENMLRQVWQNLLGNAIKYSAHSEPATITVEHGIADNGEHVFSVRDNGVGFDMAHAGKLFGVFQRLHGAGDFGGTGIGLASVRRVLSRHGGRVWAEAVPGEGASFHFTLPVMSDLAEPIEAIT